MYINRTIKCLKRLQKPSIDDNLRQLVFGVETTAKFAIIFVYRHNKKLAVKSLCKKKISPLING